MAKNKTRIDVITVFDGELDATDVFVSLIAQKHSQKSSGESGKNCRFVKHIGQRTH